tara:strand:- start:28 stop:231 length:204 start_codon:yes stop_codon:yes gene_type:complete
MKFFSMNNTKAELLAEVKRLHNDKEATGLELIKKGSILVYQQVKYELPLLIKDIKAAGSYCRKLLPF